MDSLRLLDVARMPTFAVHPHYVGIRDNLLHASICRCLFVHILLLRDAIWFNQVNHVIYEQYPALPLSIISGTAFEHNFARLPGKQSRPEQAQTHASFEFKLKAFICMHCMCHRGGLECTGTVVLTCKFSFRTGFCMTSSAVSPDLETSQTHC